MKDDKITSRIRLKYFVLFLVIYIIWSLSYTLIGNWTVNMKHYTLSTKINRNIPFIPDFEYIYALGYLIPFIPLIVIRYVYRMNLLIVSFVVLNLISFTLFILFPVYCPRPGLEVSSLSSYLLSLERAVDMPVNNFPSLHAGIAWLIFLSCRGYSKILSAILFSIAIGIGISALFIKQHFTADIVAGITLAWVVYSILNHFFIKLYKTATIK